LGCGLFSPFLRARSVCCCTGRLLHRAAHSYTAGPRRRRRPRKSSKRAPASQQAGSSSFSRSLGALARPPLSGEQARGRGAGGRQTRGPGPESQSAAAALAVSLSRARARARGPPPPPPPLPPSPTLAAYRPPGPGTIDSICYKAKPPRSIAIWVRAEAGAAPHGTGGGGGGAREIGPNEHRVCGARAPRPRTRRERLGCSTVPGDAPAADLSCAP